MIKEQLQKVGLTPGESEIYELLLQSGETKAGSIIKKANITSSKVYDVLQRLIHKGLVSFIEKQGIKHYQAMPPQRLIEYLEEKKDAIAKVQEDVHKIMPLLQKKDPVQNSVRMFIGKQGPKIVLKELLEASKRTKNNYGYGTPKNPYAKYFPHEFKEYLLQEKKHKLKTKLLFAKGHIEKQPTAQIRYLPPEFMVPVRTMIAANKVFLVDFTDNMTTIIIENKQIAQSYEDHFKFLWNMAESLAH